MKRAGRRYSKQLLSLLTEMLQSDPRRRVDFAQLIDQLNPVLLLNLQAIKQLHTPSAAQTQQGKGDSTLKGKGSLVKGKDNFLK